MTNLDSILKGRDITLSAKVHIVSSVAQLCLTLRPHESHIVKAMVFPVVMYRCESRTIKKSEGLQIDAFKLWSWRRLLRVSWTIWRSN